MDKKENRKLRKMLINKQNTMARRGGKIEKLAVLKAAHLAKMVASD